jgi:hypothetical protein
MDEKQSSAPESKTVEAADVDKEYLKLCSKSAEECDGEKSIRNKSYKNVCRSGSL